MIDFENGFFKLSPVEPDSVMPRVGPLLIDGEYIVAAFKTIRDSVIFTNKRVVTINVQGLTGKKTDYTSLPYSRLQAYSVETSGHFDRDSELDLFFGAGIGQIRFELKGGYDIVNLCKLISAHIL